MAGDWSVANIEKSNRLTGLHGWLTQGAERERYQG